MTTYQKSIRNGTLTVAALLLLSLSGWLWVNNKDLEKRADQATLRQDSILASKLLLDKEIHDLNLVLAENSHKNAALDSTILGINALLSEKMKVINGLSAENASVKRLKKELNDLKALRQKFERQVQELLAENAQLKAENRLLADKLAARVIPLPEVLVNTGNFRITLQRSNSKPTLRSGKIRNVSVSFEVKSNSKETVSQNVYVLAKDANGNVISEASPAEFAQIKGETVSYSAKQKVEIGETARKVAVTIKASARIKAKGVITLLVYSDNEGLIGSAEVQSI